MNKFYYLFPDRIYKSKEEKPTYEKGNFISRSYFKQALEDWLSSCDKYRVAEGEESKFLNSVEPNELTRYGFDFTSDLQSGIKIDSERVEFMSPFGYDEPVCAYFVAIEDKPKEEINYRQKLFNYMHNEHGVMLLESDMDEIENIINPKKYPYTI